MTRNAISDDMDEKALKRDTEGEEGACVRRENERERKKQRRDVVARVLHSSAFIQIRCLYCDK